MVHVHGRDVSQRAARIGKVPADRRLLVPVDVGKHEAMALVAGGTGERLVAPFTFTLDRPGLAEFVQRIDRVVGGRGDVQVEVGVESAGHYHRPVTASSMLPSAWTLIELNPGPVGVVAALDPSDVGDLGLHHLGHHLQADRGRGGEQPLTHVCSERGQIAVKRASEQVWQPSFDGGDQLQPDVLVVIGGWRAEAGVCEPDMWGPPSRLGGLREPASWPAPGGGPHLKFHGPQDNLGSFDDGWLQRRSRRRYVGT